jgi:hypothetical protein
MEFGVIAGALDPPKDLAAIGLKAAEQTEAQRS